MVSLGRGSSGGGRGIFVQAGDGIAWSGGIPVVVMARLSFRSFCVMYSACFLWYSSSASGLVASDVLPEDLCSDFVTTCCLFFRLRSATSMLFVFVILIQIQKIKLQEEVMLEIDGIEPNSGPLNGETRVLVRLKNFDEKYTDVYPQPKVTIVLNFSVNSERKR